MNGSRARTTSGHVSANDTVEQAARLIYLRKADAAALTQFPPTEPADSLEVRWFLPDSPGAAALGWFGRFPARNEAREDTYLVWPRLDGLSVKLRDGGGLDVKSYLGSPAILGLPACGQGRVESWRKWSFACDVPHLAGATPAGWVTVRKARRSTWFPLSAGQGPAPVRSPEAAGCMVELTEADAGVSCWTVGLEATGPPRLLLEALQHAADLLFAWPLPDGVQFSLGNSWSYAQWLHQQPGAHPC